MEHGLLGGAEDGEHIGVDFLQISRKFPMPDTFFFVTEPFDGALILANLQFKTLAI